jgi:hypothetical protein
VQERGKGVVGCIKKRRVEPENREALLTRKRQGRENSYANKGRNGGMHTDHTHIPLTVTRSTRRQRLRVSKDSNE